MHKYPFLSNYQSLTGHYLLFIIYYLLFIIYGGKYYRYFVQAHNLR